MWDDQGLWYEFATTQGAYHVAGVASTQDLINLPDGLNDENRGWTVSVKDKLYAYDYISKADGTYPQKDNGYLEDGSYWYQIYDFSSELNLIAISNSQDYVNKFNNLNTNGIIFKIKD